MMALPFLPEHDIEEAWEEVKGSLPAALESVSEYFEETWAGASRRFLISLWNQWNNVVSHQSRTNNQLEGFHNGLLQMCGGSNMKFYRLVDVLKDVISKANFDMVQHLHGRPPPPRKKKYTNLDTMLSNVVASYDFDDAAEYLDKISNLSIFGL